MCAIMYILYMYLYVQYIRMYILNHIFEATFYQIK